MWIFNLIFLIMLRHIIFIQKIASDQQNDQHCDAIQYTAF